jgi:hypothetical protein
MSASLFGAVSLATASTKRLTPPVSKQQTQARQLKPITFHIPILPRQLMYLLGKQPSGLQET